MLERMGKMRKILSSCLMFFIILCFSVCVNAQNDTDSDLLRVGISYGSDAKSEVFFASDGDVSVTNGNGDAIAWVPAGERLEMHNVENLLMSDYFVGGEERVILESVGTISFNDSPYRGKFEVTGKNGKITVVNIVKEDDYLASLLGKEMSASWPIEALKAQAVCARNYAITIAGKHESDGFDICNSQHCQVYGGMKSEAESTRRAVEETSKVTVTYKGEVVPLYYFSCDGGYTEDSENVWINALGYLRGKKDIHENPNYATRYNWSVTYTKDEIENILNTKGMGVGELSDITVDSVSDNNGVLKLTFVGDEGERTVSKTQTRTVLSLNSQAYEIEKNSSAPIVREETETAVRCVLTADGIVNVTNPVYTVTDGGTERIEYAKVTVREESGGYDSYTFNGHGWGHLVGMSQWGAYSMAMGGYSYEDILNFYFTDIEIVKSEFNEDEDLYTEETHWSDTGI